MNDFDYDNLQRKRIARNARYKKNGSKSRKCTLPQDMMTAAQLKRRNGEVNTFNLGKPMKWNEFNTMPDDLKIEYIEMLRLSYNASNSKIAEMMDKPRASIVREIARLGLDDMRKRQMSRTQEEEWEKFCNPKPVVVLDPIETITPCEEPEEEKQDTAPSHVGCAINSGLLQFTGKAPDIAIALMKFLGDREYRICVEFEEMA